MSPNKNLANRCNVFYKKIITFPLQTPNKMAKKKKKKSNINQISKRELARRKKEYFKELKQTFELFGCAEAFDLIPQSHYNRIYQFRAVIVSFDKAPGHEITNKDVSYFKRIIKKQFDDPEVANIIYNENN